MSRLGWVLLGLLSAGSVACRSTSTSAEAHSRVEHGALLLDVRSVEEYAQKHLPNAVNIPVQDLAARVAEVPKDRDVVVYCHSGARSARAARLLADKGYTRITDLGGMNNW